MKKQLLTAAALAALCPLVGNAQSDSNWMDMGDLHGTIGLRLWSTEWTSWFTNDRYIKAGTETAVIPVVSVRYKEFLVSGSYLTKTDFTFDPSYKPERREYDINFGYFLLPSVAATVGYKNVHYDTTDDYDWTTKGWTVGLSASAPLAPWMSLYGNAAYGRPKINDNSGVFNGQRAKYLLTEFGLAFPLGQVTPSMNGFLATVGYRYQRIGAHPAGGIPGVGDRQLFEYTQGAVIGFSYSM